MELITMLNRCHRFRGFVYQHAHFSADKKSIKWPCDRARVRPQSARAAISRRPDTMNSPRGDSSSSACVSHDETQCLQFLRIVLVQLPPIADKFDCIPYSKFFVRPVHPDTAVQRCEGLIRE